MDESIYVEFLKWADSKGLSGFTEDEAISRFGEKIKPVLTSASKSQALVYVNVSGQSKPGQYRALGLEGKFKLLDHQELLEAKAATHEAKRQARVAFALSILSLVVAGVTGYLQLTSPTTIAPEQVSAILEAIEQTSEANESSVHPLAFWLQ